MPLVLQQRLVICESLGVVGFTGGGLPAVSPVQPLPVEFGRAGDARVEVEQVADLGGGEGMWIHAVQLLAHGRTMPAWSLTVVAVSPARRVAVLDAFRALALVTRPGYTCPSHTSTA